MKKSLALVLALVMVLSSFSFVSAAPDFADVKGTAYEEPVSRLELLNVLKGYPDGSFKPEGSITRAEFAAVAVRARGLAGVAEAAKGLPSGFVDVPATHWAAGYVGTAGSMGIVNGIGNGMFAPNGLVKYEEAVTMLVRALGYEYDAQTKGGYPFGYLIVAEEIGLLDGARGTQGTFATRGLVALLTDNALEIPMMISVGQGSDARWVVSGEERTKAVYLLDYMGFDAIEGRVTQIDSDDMEIYIDSDVSADRGWYDVADDFDFYPVEGATIKAWVDGGKVVVFTVLDDVMFDAIEVTVTEKEVKLIGVNKKYDVDADATIFVNGSEAEVDDLVKGAKHDYAKVVLNDDGDVIWLDGYVWDDFFVVEKTDSDEVFSLNDELDVEDYTIVMDGKTIALGDIEKGDILFYNSDAEFAEVYNKTFAGEFEDIFANEFEVAGKSFTYTTKYATANVQYVNEKTKLANFTVDVAEQMEDEGDVTVFVDRHNKAVFVDGDLGAATKTTFSALLYTQMVGYPDLRDREILEFDVVTEEGEEATYTVRLSDLKTIERDFVVWEKTASGPALSLIDWTPATNTATGINIPGTSDDVFFAAAGAKGRIIEVTVDEDGDVIGLGFFSVPSAPFVFSDIKSAGVYETGDRYFKDYRMSSDVVVYLIGASTWDEEDVEVTTFGEMDEEVSFLNFDLYHDGNDAMYVVAFETTMTKTSTKTGVITEVREDSVGIVRVKALVDGAAITYRAEKAITGTWKAGQAARFVVVDKTGELRDIEPAWGDDFVVGAGYKVVTADREIFENASTSWKLVSGGYVYDVAKTTDIKTMSWTNLKDVATGTPIAVVYDQQTSSGNTYYVKYILVGIELPALEVSAGADFEIYVGGSHTPVAPTSNPTGATFTFVSSNTGVATVNASGTVTGLAAGTATITVKGTLDGYSAGTDSFVVTVLPVPATVYTMVYGSDATTQYIDITAPTGLVTAEYAVRIKTESSGLPVGVYGVNVNQDAIITDTLTNNVVYTAELIKIDAPTVVLASYNFVAVVTTP